MYTFLLPLAAVISTTVAASNYTLLNTWPGGFQAELCITNKMNVICGWRVAIDFNPKLSVLDIWNVRRVDRIDMTKRKERYIVESFSYNQVLKKNEDLCLGFVARYSNNQMPNIRKLKGKFLYRCKVPTTPAPATTSAITSGTTTPLKASPTTPTTTPTETTSTTSDTTQSTSATTSGTTSTSQTTPTTSQTTPTTSPTTPTTSQTTPATSQTTPATSQTTPATSQTTPTTSPTTPATSQTTPTTSQTTPTTSPTTPTTSQTTPATSQTTPATSQTTPTTSQTTSQSTSTTQAPQAGKFDYNQVLGLSIMFYEAQRSGKLPETNRITWRGDSALGDKGGNTDLTGGWYDAGDYIKFTLPMSSAVTYLLWGLLRWPDAYAAAGQLDYVYDSVKWPLDYLLKSWDPTQMEFYAQVGKVSLDHTYWGRSEDMDMERPAYKVSRTGPGSDVAGQTATALAMGYLAFKERNMTYATTLLDAAKGLYDFAKNYRGVYSDTITDARDVYKSSMYEDELALAAVWLHKATGESTYLVDAETFVPMYTAWSLDWDGKIAAAQLALYEVTGKQTYRDQVEAFVTSYMPGGTVPNTPLGLAYRSQWGALRYAANVAMFALIAADDGINAAEYREWALSQIHYILGDNKYGMSYVIGYGDNYPRKPHHAGSSCPDRPASCTWNEFNSPAPNPQILYGALVGGPDQNDNYVDDRTDYVKNEVACDYNAGMQSAIAGIIHLRETNQLPEDAVSSTTSPPGQRSTLAPVTVTDSGPTASTASPGCASAHNLSQVLEFSILFYEAQRSGDLPDTNRIPWRGDSALDDTVPGGWYDAGDHIKFTFPMSAAVTYLLLGVHAWKDAYVASGQLNNMYDSIRWPLDYFLNSWDPTKQELYVQVGKVSLDHAVWGRAEDMTMDRPAYKLSPSGPGSDAAAGTAAAMAIGAIVFQKEDPVYASRLLTAAAELYDFANTYTGIYTDTVTDSRDGYGSNDYNDELALAAIWLYKATRQQHYLTDARTHASKLSSSPWALDWSDKTAIVHLAMYEETQEEKYSDAIKAFMTSYLPGGSVAYTPCGLAWRLEWGPLRYTANVAMFALLAADAGFEPQTYRSWALGQIGYMLGENNAGRSYVVGYGSNYPVRPHHQNSACHPHPAVCDWSTFDDPAPNAHVLKGALVGGPGSNDNYVDDRTDYIQNEVACDYNSGFQSAIAGLLHLEITNQFPVSALNRCYP